MTDIAALVEDAKAKGTFSVLEAAQGRTYPQDIRTVYTDVESAFKIHALEALDKDETDPETHEHNVAQIDALKAKIADSALTFRMRGIGAGVKKAIRTEGLLKFPVEYDAIGNVTGGGVDYGEGAIWSNHKTIAEHIVDVTDIDGNVDEHHWSVEDVEQLEALLPEESYNELVDLMFSLSFVAAFFDASVTPDFS